MSKLRTAARMKSPGSERSLRASEDLLVNLQMALTRFRTHLFALPIDTNYACGNALTLADCELLSALYVIQSATSSLKGTLKRRINMNYVVYSTVYIYRTACQAGASTISPKRMRSAPITREHRNSRPSRRLVILRRWRCRVGLRQEAEL